MNTQQIELDNIVFNRDFQAREQMSRDTLEEYMDAMKDGAKFPPVVVYQDGSKYYLADGYHRVAAALKLERKTINAEIHVGSRRDAVLYAVGANSNHGLRRTRADKRRAVRMLLLDDEWQQWSDREIARRAGVNHVTVGKIRGEMVSTGEINQSDERKTASGRTINTSNIGENQLKKFSEMNNGVRRLNKDWIEANFDTDADWHVLHKRIDEQVNANGFTFIKTNHGFLYIGKEKVIRSAVQHIGIEDSGEWYYTQNHHGSCWLIESILLFEKVAAKLHSVIYYPALDHPTHTFANQHVRFNSKKKKALRALPPAIKPVQFQPYDLVETRIGRLGLVRSVQGKIVTVRDKNSMTATHYNNTLKLIERPELPLTAETFDGYFERIGFKQDRGELFRECGLSHLLWQDDQPPTTYVETINALDVPGQDEKPDPLIRTFALGDRVDGFYISKGEGTVVAIEGNWLVVDFDEDEQLKVKPAFVNKIKAEEPSDTLHDETDLDNVPARESLEQSVQLPVRQIEFLEALAAGEPVVKNAATRLALRGHGYITETDDWNAIELTEAGKVALLNHKMPKGVTVEHVGTYNASELDRMYSDLSESLKPQQVKLKAQQLYDAFDHIDRYLSANESGSPLNTPADEIVVYVDYMIERLAELQKHLYEQMKQVS